MLWAAWADALGFISELTDEAGLRRRLHGRTLDDPVAWTRRIGGRFGVDMQLPAGCYSDDTQLRLATARAISPRGFDIDAFARVELTVWPAYALGGGRATKAAAANLAKPSTPWFGNFFTGWLEAGGNGVAMRIQPHVWAARRPSNLGPHIVDILANATTTHGHPRALVGAVFHALALGATLDNGAVPQPDQWIGILDTTDQAIKLLDEHPQLSNLWRPSWEQATGENIHDAWHTTVEECRQMLTAATHAHGILAAANQDEAAHNKAYHVLIEDLGLADSATRGSGTATTMAALVLAAAHPTHPARCARLAARAIGTDTDTIATMAAALSGAEGTNNDGAAAPQPLLDDAYLIREAERLARIATGQPATRFVYPDPLNWTPPRTQLDTVGTVDGQLVLAGLGEVTAVSTTPAEGTSPAETTDSASTEVDPPSRNGSVWQWMRSDFGPTLLLKRRLIPRRLPDGSRPAPHLTLSVLDPIQPEPGPSGRNRRPPRHATPDPIHTAQPTLYDTASMTGEQTAERRQPEVYLSRAGSRARPQGGEPPRSGLNVDEMLAWLASQDYPDQGVGYAVRRLVEDGTLEQLIAFTTALHNIAKRHPRRNNEPWTEQ